MKAHLVFQSKTHFKVQGQQKAKDIHSSQQIPNATTLKKARQRVHVFQTFSQQ